MNEKKLGKVDRIILMWPFSEKNGFTFSSNTTANPPILPKKATVLAHLVESFFESANKRIVPPIHRSINNTSINHFLQK